MDVCFLWVLSVVMYVQVSALGRSLVWRSPTECVCVCVCVCVSLSVNSCRARSEPGGTRWRTGGEVKRKQANGVGSQYNSTLPRNVVCPVLLPLLLLIRTPRLPVVDWTDAPTDLNGLVPFGEWRNLVSAHVPSRSARAITTKLYASNEYV